MRLDHQRVASSVKAARAGFTVMEVLLALSLTVVIIGVTLGGLVAYSRAGAAATALEELNVTAKTLEDQLKRDLVLLSRTRTFVNAGACPAAGERGGTRLVLLDEHDGQPYFVEYWPYFPGAVARSVDVNGMDVTYKVFEGVYDFHIGCLTNGQVTTTATVRERLEGAGSKAGQQVAVRVTSAVRMR